MSDQYLGEIRIAAFNFAPQGWALCNGQLLPINQNQPLFAILGTTYGGDGRVNFALPNLQGRMPLHVGSQFTLGRFGGETSHSLLLSELPAHNHLAAAQTAPGAPGTSPAGALPAAAPAASYASSPTVAMLPTSVSAVGGSQLHENRAPYLVVTMMIAVTGIFPSRN
jgi:microcystin-dependent protein